MYRDQAYILSNIAMILDAIMVVFAAYVSRWIYLSYFGQTWELGEYEFAGFIIFSSFFSIILFSLTWVFILIVARIRFGLSSSGS